MRRWEVITTVGLVNLEADTWLVTHGMLQFLDGSERPLFPAFSMAQVVQWRPVSE